MGASHQLSASVTLPSLRRILLDQFVDLDDLVRTLNMPSQSPNRARIARQHLETARLMGVDFVPINAPQPESTATTPGPAVEIEVTIPPGPMHTATATTQSAPKKSTQEKTEALQALRTRHDETCTHCTVATDHTQTVFGEGSPDAQLMFIGEAPGEREDQTGRPFVGRAGKKLDEIITAMGLARADVYIANVLKSRPLGNRTPTPSEVDQCAAYLAEQIRIIQPKVIVGLGGPAVKWLLGTTVGITRLRGQWDRFTNDEVSIPVMPTFHPAYLLRNYTPDTRGKVWSDMQQVMAYLQPPSN